MGGKPEVNYGPQMMTSSILFLHIFMPFERA